MTNEDLALNFRGLSYIYLNFAEAIEQGEPVDKVLKDALVRSENVTKEIRDLCKRKGKKILGEAVR